MSEKTVDKERAKRLIVELVRQAGGRFRNKTNLNKAFWRAHLYFAKEQGRHLSRWPIVKLPRGPAVDDLDILIGELLVEGALHLEEANYGPGVDGIVFILTPETPAGGLSECELDAVRHGVGSVDGKSASEVSDESHKDSRAWNAVQRDGDELNIFLDVISESEFLEREARIEAVKKSMERVFS